MKIYHNSRCSKSRQTLDIINANSWQVEIVEYLKTPVSKLELQSLIKMLGIKAFDLIRKGEPIFKSEFKGKNLSEDQWVQAMVDHPKLIERPIVVNGNKAIIGRPPEKVLELK